MNTISAGLKTAVAGIFETTADFAIDAFFNGNVTPPTASEDGLVLHKSTATAAYYEMISSISGTGSSRKFTGTFTGVAGTFDNVGLGFQYATGGTYNINYATPTAWDNVILAIADTLTVEWTITVGA